MRLFINNKLEESLLEVGYFFVKILQMTDIPKNPLLGLVQLQICAQLDNAEELFSKVFLVTELQWLLWAFGNNVNNKRKKNLIPLILEHLKNRTPFSNEAMSKGELFAV
ncbi:hypothetical protein GLOIN_2v1541965 [Rhizophagus irregularis DAOM 181602=DAOM 197198]|nr:hypothetical protein GLOIN_2v1541965 [Rhizophagus irregularis DAOM 181602=DAOM 197198]